jgi:hypothetical protein
LGRRTLFFWAPYFTGHDLPRIHLTLRNKGQWWKEGLITVEPPWLVDWHGPEFKVPLNLDAFFVDETKIGKIWEREFTIQGPDRGNHVPLTLRCYLTLKDFDNNEYGPFPIAVLPLKEGSDYGLRTGPILISIIALVVSTLVAICNIP